MRSDLPVLETVFWTAAVIGHDLEPSENSFVVERETLRPCGTPTSEATLPVVKRKRGRRAMEYFAGLDVSIDETAICVVSDSGDVVLETSVATDPAAIAAALAS